MPPLTFEQVVKQSNPYSSSIAFDNPIVVEQQADLGNWTFKGVPYYIEKALKVPYTYTNAAGVTVEDYLLIGFAGGGAY